MITLYRSRRLNCSSTDVGDAIAALLTESAVGPVSVCSLPTLQFHVRDHDGSWERIVRLLRRRGASLIGPQCIVAWEIRDLHACSRFAGSLSVDDDAGTAVVTLDGTCERATELGADLEEDQLVRVLSDRTAEGLLDLITAHVGVSSRTAA